MLCELPPHAAGAVVVATEESPAELIGDGAVRAERRSKSWHRRRHSWRHGENLCGVAAGRRRPGSARGDDRSRGGAVDVSSECRGCDAGAHREAAEMWLDVFGDSRSSTSAWFSRTRRARRCSGGDAVAGTRERDGVDVARGMESARARRGLRGGRNEGRGMRAAGGGMGYTELSVDGHSGTAVVSYAARPRCWGCPRRPGTREVGQSRAWWEPGSWTRRRRACTEACTRRPSSSRAACCGARALR